VRLKQVTTELARTKPAPFNTKKVRLKPLGTKPRIIFDKSPFNTKKVRLKPNMQFDINFARKPFNTKKVRLKLDSTRSGGASWKPFNTKKVRLKRITKQIHDFFKKDFQYQKGAIKTRPEPFLPKSLKTLSIPKRCD